MNPDRLKTALSVNAFPPSGKTEGARADASFKCNNKVSYFKRGFTLIELLVVIAIIAILAAIQQAVRQAIIEHKQSGDPIVVSGGYAIPDGTAIEIEKPSAAGEKDGAGDKPNAQPEKDKD